MALNPKVSASIQEDYSDWAAIKGIQLQGSVVRVEGDAATALIDAYAKKFPIIGCDAPKEISDALDKIGWFELCVERLFFTDNSKGLGHRVELNPVHFFTI